MKTGLANMALGIVIALVGALVTAFTYSMVSRGGGTYVVAYGAFVVGAWRFLLGVFQLLRAAVGGSEPPRQVASPATNTPPRYDTPYRSNGPARTNPDGTLNALQLVGGALIGDSALRIVFLALFLLRIPNFSILNGTILVTSVILPLALAIAGIIAGTLILRNQTGAIPFGLGLCVIGLLYHGWGLVGLFAHAAYIPSITWIMITLHIVVYLAGLIVLLRALNRRDASVASIG